MRAGSGRLITTLLFATAGAGLPGGALPGQELATPELRGRVLVGDAPAAGAMVVLHRVDAVDPGEVDSVRADRDGGFLFRLPTVPDPGGRGDVYLASVRHQDVLYFGRPITTAVELDSLYLVQTWDTVAAPPGGAPVTVSVRYVLAQEIPGGWRITDLFELDVPGDRTWVAADSAPTWSYPLPAGFSELQIGGGDGGFTEVVAAPGGLAVSAPLSPGPRQVIVRYTLPSLLTEFPVPGGAGEMDFLVREPAPSLEVSGLAPTESVEIEPGANYRRFSGIGVPDTTLLVVEVPEPFSFPFEWLVVILGLGLAGVGLWATVGRGPRDTAGGGASSPRQGVVAEVARLDLEIERLPPGAERDRLVRRRRSLAARLRDPG